MKIRFCLVLVFIVISSNISFTDLYSEETQQKPSRQAAMDAFSNGDYEKAFREFEILLQAYSKDPLYKYYSGVCLIKMNREPENASLFLREALNGSLDIKSIPDDAWFYLGRSQQMAGRFPDAIDSYNNFEEKAGKKRARDLSVSGYIQECKERRGGPGQNTSAERSTAEKTTVQPAVKTIPQKQDVPVSYDKVLSEAMKYQVKADSLNVLVAEYRKEYDKLPPSQKQAAKSRISETESLSAEYQKMADEKFGNTITQPPVRKEVAVTPLLPETNRREEIYSIFNIETDPARLRNQKISLDPEIPAGLVYRIQVGVFSKQMNPSFFKGISPVSGFKIPGTESTKYFAGLFRRMADASRSVVTVKQMGFKDSFVTAVLYGKTVSLERASLMENEWGQKPLILIAPVQKTGGTIASTLIFRVEVTRSVKPVGDETAEVYRKMAGNRGFEIITAENGTFVYLIGKFITFESASEYSDLLKRNGYRDAKVSAYLGSKEIPVETAKQLFEK
jgi:tetratricopeptide (TPR) repeat protein